MSPEPPQVAQGSSITSPVPPHWGQGWLIEKNPWLWASIPRPPQRGQTLGAVPGLAPEPPQVPQRSSLGTETEIWDPFTAWSKLSRISVSRSAPGTACAWAPPRPKMVEKMSPMSEVKPPPGPPPRPPKPPNIPPLSYCLRFSGSDSVS